QVFIYLGKLLRMFVYQNDWKVLPMAALIAGLVGMVVRRKFFINMEGTVMGAFAMVCVCIWNGCFNSIQVICRERDVIKREHRSGMHISSYIVAHMIYQALLCLMQVAVTLFVTKQVGVKYPVEGKITSLFIVEFGISMFLITYASDMMSLWISSLAHTTTTAMTIMPFVLIFQLVFSGGMLTLPKWSKPLTYLTVSNPGLKVIAAQADVNHQPYATIADMVKKMKDEKIDATITVGQIMDMLAQKDNGTVSAIRGQVVVPTMTLGELKQTLDSSATVKAHRDDAIAEGLTLGDALDLIDQTGLWEQNSKEVVTSQMTIGDIIDLLVQNPDFQSQRDRQIGMPAKVGDILNLVGEDKAMKFLEEKAAAANYKPEYEYTADNVSSRWLTLFIFVLAFAALSTITLEFIDRDKR
ncbi:MAG: ABC transporter permease, partial [Clostridia bacterium]|nr:ABC transporter permease [Clostridia bacterium]